VDVLRVPFNALLGIARASVGSGYLLELADSPSFANHLGGVHASAQLSLAEATSGEFLVVQFGAMVQGTVPVVRRLEAKFKRPAQGRLRSRARVADEDLRKFVESLETRGRSLITVQVELFDDRDTVTMNCSVEWFIQKANERIGGGR